MGICCNRSMDIPLVSFEKYSINNCNIELIVGNIFLHNFDAILILTNPILKIDAKYLNYDIIKIQKECIKYIKIKRNLQPGDIFISSGVKCKNIVHAVCPNYLDGTTGEPDYLKLAISQGLKKLSELGATNIAINTEWVYPKLEFSKILVNEINTGISQYNFTNICLFNYEIYMVILI